MVFHWIDWLPLSFYFLLLIYLTWRGRSSDNNEVSFLLSGRKMTLPAFVATLVSTWYGGILGVGEYSVQFGLAQWFLFGFPFYVFALLYAWFLAGPIREHAGLTIPEAMRMSYGKKASVTGAAAVFLLVSPAPYILMLGMIAEFIFGGGWLIYSVIVALFSVIYVSYGGFGAVVRTDMLQVALMYGGFLILATAAWSYYGSPLQLWSDLPDTHTSLTGGHSVDYILVWFFIALWTFVDPSFHQRSAAADSPETAKKGITISVGFWMVFDTLTLLCGLYAFVILSDLENPILAYPELSAYLLGPGLNGLFFTALIAVIMSTLDSFLFLSGQTLGRDMLRPLFPNSNPVKLTRIAVVIAAIIALVMIMIFPSVIELWYVIGSILVPVLLIPILGVYIPFFRVKPGAAMPMMIFTLITASGWMLAGILTGETDLYSYAWLGVEPFYPGLGVSVVVWILFRERM